MFPTATSLRLLKQFLILTVGTQNAYATASGSFTGEIGTTFNLMNLKFKTILIGHSERRHILGENSRRNNSKIWIL